MTTRAESRAGVAGYPLRFGLVALVLVAAALFLVFFVLPRRYILSSGFQESGVNFPTVSTPVPPGMVVQRTAPPPPVLRVADETPPPLGPAERFWAQVLPLIEAGAAGEAVGVIREYLGRFPGDRGARRELANALFASDRPAEAAEELTTLLAEEEDPDLRIVLARIYRDLGRLDAASAQYAFLYEQGYSTPQLTLEWARALSWVELYEDAEAVLVSGLESAPGDPALQVELARIYYYTDRLREGELLLLSLDPEVRRAQEAETLLVDLQAALAPPEEVEEIPVWLEALRRAQRARDDGDPDTAGRILRDALASDPERAELLLAYADLLQYDVLDLEGALAALESLALQRPDDLALQWRLALLENWTGRSPEALDRLDRLGARLGMREVPLDAASPAAGTLNVARIETLRGDLLRWSGSRQAAAQAYEAALAYDAASADAAAGLDLLRAELNREISEEERAGASLELTFLADTDEYQRLDLGGRATTVSGRWAWSARGGRRALEGFLPAGPTGSSEGLFGEFEVARWWGWGQARTAVRLGVQGLRDAGEDLTLGLALRLRDGGGTTWMASYSRGPAYEDTRTLQSLLADVVQDQIRVSASRQLTPVWALWAELNGGRLQARDISGSPGNTRLQGALSLARRLPGGVSMGVTASTLTFRESSPLLSGRPLYWDPRLSVAVAPLLTWEARPRDGWSLAARLAPGVARLEERRSSGTRWVPNITAEAGLVWRAEGVTSSLDLLYGQARFDGYRAWGARWSLRIPGLFGGGGAHE